MDPISAFALAGTVVAFIDFGSKLFKLTWGIYHGEDPSVHVTELTKIVQSFETMSTIPDSTDPISSSSEDCLDRLRIESQEFSTKLIEYLRKGGFLDLRMSSKKEVLRAKFRLILHKGELEKLKAQLIEFRERLGFQVLISLRQFAFQTLNEQEKILEALHISRKDSGKLQSDMQTILQYISDEKNSSNSNQWRNTLQQDLIRQIYGDDNSEHKKSAHDIVLPLQTCAKMEKDLLVALAYTDMEERQGQIAIAFETTFHWVLSKLDSETKKWQSLTAWFEGQDQIYWINGKAGSGKSTLMKFLAYGAPTESRSYPFLKKWAGEKDLMIVAFYFWASDPGPMQKSHSGLFRTLLHRILSAYPDLASIVFPSRWEALAIAGMHPELSEWTETELHGCLIRAIMALGTKNVCICLFIDGLDEFDGDPKTMIQLMQELTGLGKYVKLCIASRPWIEYRTNFASLPQLRLQDLTYDDIKLFVTTRLQNHTEFAKLRLREAAFADQLIENIISKASGVFLWVSLVVSSLLLGMTEGDRIRDLQESLDKLPPGLNQLYERILAGMLEGDDQRNNGNRAEMIMLMESAGGSIPLSTFAFAEEGSLPWLRSLPRTPMAKDTLHAYTTSTHTRLISRWKGLLEVGRPFEDADYHNSTDSQKLDRDRPAIVHYLHRTVREFVSSEKMRSFLERELDPKFDPHLQICIALCACTIALDPIRFRRNAAFRYARQVSKDRQVEMVEALAQIPCTDASQVKHSPIASSSLIDPSKETIDGALLTIAAAEGVLPYIKSKIGRNYDQDLLNQMLAAAVNSPSTNHETVCWLLERGADPQHQQAFTRFNQHILKCERVSSLSALDKGMRRCLISFVAHGSGVDIISPSVPIYRNRPNPWPASIYEELQNILVRPVRHNRSPGVEKISFMNTLYSYLPTW